MFLPVTAAAWHGHSGGVHEFMEAQIITSILAATIVAGTPLIFAALGELVCEKSGILNLGVEGMMALGAVVGFATTLYFDNPLPGALAAITAGMLVSLIFAFLTITLLANQVASGLALAIFGTGLSAFIGKFYEGESLQAIPAIRLPLVADIPVIGEALFNQQAIVYVSWAIFALLIWFLYGTRPGLVLRAIGESPSSAYALGYPVTRYRYGAVLFGGAMAGMGGGFLSVFHTPIWSEGIVAGKGWVALALVVFASWRPWRIMLGAYLFGGVLIAQLFIQGSGLPINMPSQLLSALPYLATIVVLVIISRNRLLVRVNSPASLAQPWRHDC